MSDVSLCLPATEAQALYRLLHQLPEGQDLWCETYRQLQDYFFERLTIDELTSLLEDR